ncbi:uncharacterized protein LOC142172417 [Nicotiana tabacum]|uniref:Uncharacterized protein LOC142172417 n=1 Tax=Nicotiana tabacum TaxID=4097 RepID=A0AC58T4H4_TOBAC
MTSESNFVQVAIPCFDGHYDNWSMLMENFLRSKEYWPIVEEGIKAPTAIERPILETIHCKETSKDIWDSMKKKYQGSTRVKRAQLQALRRDFETLQMKDGGFVTNYYARTMEIWNKMRFHGDNMGDAIIVEKILCSLTPKYDYVVCSIEESKDIDVLSLDELQSSLLVHEQKMNRSSTSDEQALKVSTFISSSNSRGRGGGRGRGRGRGDRGGRDSSRNFKANNDQSQGKGRGFRSKVSFGDCSTVDATGKGDIKIKTKNDFGKTISNVLYVPDLKSNLLSVGQLQEKGYVITIKKGECEIYDPVRELLQ